MLFKGKHALISYYTVLFTGNHKVTLRITELQNYAEDKVTHQITIKRVHQEARNHQNNRTWPLLTLFTDFSGVFTVRSACFPFFEGVLFIFGEWNLPFNFIVNEERWERSESRKTQKSITGLGQLCWKQGRCITALSGRHLHHVNLLSGTW